MSKITCVDISEFQQNIDFNKMKNDGIKAVIIRAGYGRETSQKDSMFESHFRNAKNANLKIGVYWYSYADSVDDAEKEANACLACIGGKALDMPVYYDMEDNFQTHLSKSTLTAIAERFCDTVKANGYKVGVYANLNWFNNYLDYKKLKSKYSIWLAQYNDKAELACDIWQNSSMGKVSGYGGNIDTNVIYNDNIFGKSETKVKKPTLTYRVFADGKWYSEVKGLGGVAGRFKQAISGLMIKVSEGNIRYRVHLRDGDWLDWVDGYNKADSNNGYAGILGKVIDAVQVEFSGVDDYKATYRARKQGKNKFMPYQHNTEKDSSQDGYAGVIGTKIDGLQITLT